MKIRSSIVKRRGGVNARLDALLELLGPAWYDALGSMLDQPAADVQASLIRDGCATER